MRRRRAVRQIGLGGSMRVDCSPGSGLGIGRLLLGRLCSGLLMGLLTFDERFRTGQGHTTFLYSLVALARRPGWSIQITPSIVPAMRGKCEELPRRTPVHIHPHQFTSIQIDVGDTPSSKNVACSTEIRLTARHIGHKMGAHSTNHCTQNDSPCRCCSTRMTPALLHAGFI